VPFKIGAEEFNKVFYLTDGIYPAIDRFARPIAAPVHPAERKYTNWQESARKDIERAFGILKNTWQFVQNPIRLMDLHQIGQRVSTVLILHNMLVSDRIMQGDINAMYNPNLAGADDDCAALNEQEMEEGNIDPSDNAIPLSERQEHMRLQNAIKSFLSK